MCMCVFIHPPVYACMCALFKQTTNTGEHPESGIYKLKALSCLVTCCPTFIHHQQSRILCCQGNSPWKKVLLLFSAQVFHSQGKRSGVFVCIGCMICVSESSRVWAVWPIAVPTPSIALMWHLLFNRWMWCDLFIQSPPYHRSPPPRWGSQHCFDILCFHCIRELYEWWLRERVQAGKRVLCNQAWLILFLLSEGGHINLHA